MLNWEGSVYPTGDFLFAALYNTNRNTQKLLSNTGKNPFQRVACKVWMLVAIVYSKKNQRTLFKDFLIVLFKEKKKGKKEMVTEKKHRQ